MTVRRQAYRQMVLVGLLWGTIGPAAAIVAETTSLSPLQGTLWRLLLAALPLAAVARLVTRARLPRGRALGLAVAVGATNAAFQLAYFAAVASAGIAVPTLVALGLGPVLCAVGETVLFGAQPDRRTFAALAVALLGLGLLVLDGPARATVGGVALAVAAACGYAATTLAAGPASRRMETTSLNAVAVAAGALTVLPVALLSGGVGVPDSGPGWLALLHLGLVISGLAYWLYFRAARALPSTHITILALLEPVTAAVIAALLFGETLTAGAIVGGLLLLGAVAGLRAPAEPDRPATAP